MKRYNISLPKKYTKDGQEKTQWNNVGTMAYFPKTDSKDEGYAIELHMFPETKFFVFEQKPREDKLATPAINYNEGEVNPDEIPF